MHFSPDIFSAGKGLSVVDSATLRRANGPVRMAFHTYKINSAQIMKLNLVKITLSYLKKEERGFRFKGLKIGQL